MIFSALSSLSALTYSNLLRVAIIYACLYFFGIYWLLRALRGGPLWAAAGCIAAAATHLYFGFPPYDLCWRYPSGTVLRYAMDVWFFLALLKHLQTGRRIWTMIAGAFVGLALLFETDTGIYLVVTFLVYWLYSIGMSGLSGKLPDKVSTP